MEVIDFVKEKITIRNKRAAALKAVARDCDFGHWNFENTIIGSMDGFIDEMVERLLGLTGYGVIAEKLGPTTQRKQIDDQ